MGHSRLLNIEALINGRTSQSSLVGIGSKRHVDGLGEELLKSTQKDQLKRKSLQPINAHGSLVY